MSQSNHTYSESWMCVSTVNEKRALPEGRYHTDLSNVRHFEILTTQYAQRNGQGGSVHPGRRCCGLDTSVTCLIAALKLRYDMAPMHPELNPLTGAYLTSSSNR